MSQICNVIPPYNGAIVQKEYTGTFVDNSIVSQESQGVYTKVALIDITAEVAIYGNPISIITSGYASIPYPTNFTYVAGSAKWYAQVLGSPNCATCTAYITYTEQLQSI